ncbi:hypothetical protein FNF28_01549 [Cafeteria roenbergensis]|uniref:Helicase ATP-binding domain-containing protein n=1 Tax=Cafeteria roenbergensis TaxID=33653 RepID=A0A5A8E344_CAFRO|nr:hypothetical protein FNF28_01549 [Cafeteria roenbergensis]
MWEAIETRKVGVFESPTGTGKTLSIICSALHWLKSHESDDSSYGWSDIPGFADELQAPEPDPAEAAQPARADAHDADAGDAPEPGVPSATGRGLSSPTRRWLARSKRPRAASPTPCAPASKLPAPAWLQEAATDGVVGEEEADDEEALLLDAGDDAGGGSGSGGGGGGGGGDGAVEAVDRLGERLLAARGGVDVEEAAALGRRHGACPYYAVRKALPLADVVALPYTSLLSESARGAVGIGLRGAVVVVDEAHNLAAAAGQANGAVLTGLTLLHACRQAEEYLRRYRSRLRGRNVPSASGRWMLFPSELWAAGRADHLNLHDLSAWADAAGLSRKLRGFVDVAAAAAAASAEAAAAAAASGADGRAASDGAGAAPRMGAASAMQSVCGFLQACLQGDEDGRILVTVDVAAVTKAVAAARAAAAARAPAPVPSGGSAAGAAGKASARRHRPSATPWDRAPAAALAAVSIKFSLVAPAAAVRPLFAEPRAVVLAGGTMPPLEEMRQQLFPSLPPARITSFACGHVVGGEALCGAVMPAGPAGRRLDLSMRGRGGPGGSLAMADLGEALLRIARFAPAGMAVFLPSYAVEDSLLGPRGVWTASGLAERLGKVKRVFREPRGAEDLDAVLRDYGGAAAKGAVMFAVMGGKLSEGLNFSDGLARTVVVAGLPYANAADPELQERMARADARHGAGAGRRLYESLCMQAVNQAIGRAVRHKGDWAATVLADARFGTDRVRSRLPDWLQPHVRPHDSFAACEAALREFFAAHGHSA